MPFAWVQSITMPSVPGMGRRAAKKDDVRLAHAHITRMLANNLPPGSLADNVVRLHLACLDVLRLPYAMYHVAGHMLGVLRLLFTSCSGCPADGAGQADRVCS